MARILIVEDDPDVVAIARFSLENAWHEVESAGNRQDGMRLVGESRPDLLILDIMMGGPDDGITMAQELRRDGFDKPILMMSAISRVTGLPYGRDDAVLPADDFLEKPVMAKTLADKVDALLKRGRERSL